MNKSKKILVISTMPFPSGNASVNRIITYAKGLSELGEKVDVVTTSGGDFLWHNLDGFRYHSLVRISDKRKTGNILSLIIAISSLLGLLVKNEEKYRVIILVSNSLFLIYPLFFVAKIKGIKLLQEKSEFPFVLKKTSIIGSLYSKWYINTTYKLFDGLIIMTNPLMDFFKDKVRKKSNLFLMPMTVDRTRFDNIERDGKENYIAYCGDIGGNKDGVENLISSFNIIKEKYTDWTLLIIGGSTQVEEERIKQYAKNLNVRNLIFYGKAQRDEIPKLLTNAKILVLARPSSLQSSGGFPTKLGEYLSTSNPVIVTKVGEISKYLTDNETAFLVAPDDVEAFAKRIEYVINNYNHARKVGEEGRRLTTTIFSYQYQAKRLKDFLNNKL